MPLASLLLSCALLGVSSRAYAIGEETIAGEAFNTVVGGALTTQMQNNAVVWDLAGRYYEADPSLQDDSPLVNSVNGKTLHDYTQIQWQVEAAAQGVLDWYMVHPGTGEKIPASSPLFQSVYEDWYNYYEGITEGGGGTTGTISQIINFVPHTGYFGYNSSGDKVTGVSGISASMTMSTTSLTKVNEAVATKPNFLFLLVNKDSSYASDSAKAVEFYCSSEPITFDLVQTSTKTINGETIPVYRIDITTTTGPFGHTGFTKSSITNGLPISYAFTGSSSSSIGTSNSPVKIYNVIGVMYYASTMGGGGNQPTEPVYPTPYQPTTPEPPTSPPDNNPTNVNIGGNTYNNNSGTTSVDLTPLLEMLRIINSNIIEFETGFNNYANKVQEYLSNIYDMVYGFLQNIQDEIDDYGHLILEELREANQWLAYIFYSMGQGNGSKPDITVNTDNGLNWFEEILARLLEAMPEGLQDLITTLAELRGVFPFSIPWDLGLILSTLAGQPVTPVVDIPYPYALNRISYIRVDLTPWDGVAYQIRRGLFIVFAGGLALNTKKLLGLVEVD